MSLAFSSTVVKMIVLVQKSTAKQRKHQKHSVYRSGNTLGPEYIWKSHNKFLHPGGDENASPRMWRSHYQIIRRSDGKLLGESISYSRYGGDSRFFNELIGGPPESHHGCLEEETGTNKLIKGVFIKQSETGRTK
jgi:hypothetical protein